MRSARGALKPHHQILMISVAALIAVAMVAFLMAARVGSIHRTHGDVAGRLVPITEALTNAELLYQADMAEANQLLGPATEVPRAKTIANVTERMRLADDAWATYKRLATGVEGEKDLQFVAQASEAEQVRLIAPVLSGKALAAGTSERLARADATQIVAIETLRGRYSKRQGIAATALAVSIDRARSDLLVASSAELTLLLVGFGAVYSSVRRRDRQVRSIEVERALEAQRNNLEARLARSLEMVHTEEAAYQRIERAISEVAGGSSEALIADSSHTHLRQVVAIGSASGGGCQVGTPSDCPALVRGQTLVFPRSGELDACPYLDNRPGGPCSAVCVPLSIGGKAIGILHVTSAPDAPPDGETISRLEIIAHKAGDRIGMLRAFSRSETEAHTDQLTGLLNRRSLEAAVHRITESGQSYAVAYGDLDHFKQLNDVYGHDAGDHALRLFSRVLRDSLRPNDVCARYGGEEFVIVLPACPVGESTQVLERIRENLARAQVVAGTAPFTVSFGLAHSDAAVTFDDVLKVADGALGQAKEQGRDRVVTSAA